MVSKVRTPLERQVESLREELLLRAREVRRACSFEEEDEKKRRFLTFNQCLKGFGADGRTIKDAEDRKPMSNVGTQKVSLNSQEQRLGTQESCLIAAWPPAKPSSLGNLP